MKLTKLFSVLLALALPCAALAEAEVPQAPCVVAQGLTLGDHCIEYPQVASLEDADLMAEVNARLVAACRADELLARLPAVMSTSTPLTLRYDAALRGDVLSAAMLASGPIRTERPEQVWSCANIDLRTGEDITLDMLFAGEAEAAREALCDWLDYTVAPELSPHLLSSALTPLPDVFAIAPEGLTLYYPAEQLLTLSDRAGAVTLRWHELPGLFDMAEGNILQRIGADAFIAPGEDAAEKIAACVAAGTLPGLPVALGDSVQEATDAYRLLTDPDLYAGGRMFALEDSRFRGAWLLTDALTDKTWTASTVHGLRADCLSLYGLVTRTEETDGTAIEVWRALLGEPDATVEVDADTAEMYRIVPGTSDYYRFGDHQLRLHAGEDGQLTSIFLTE